MEFTIQFLFRFVYNSNKQNSNKFSFILLMVNVLLIIKQFIIQRFDYSKSYKYFINFKMD